MEPGLLANEPIRYDTTNRYGNWEGYTNIILFAPQRLEQRLDLINFSY